LLLFEIKVFKRKDEGCRLVCTTQSVYLFTKDTLVANGNTVDKMTGLVIFGEKLDRKLTKKVTYLISSRKEYDKQYAE
jgi:hypothetical protein